MIFKIYNIYRVTVRYPFILCAIYSHFSSIAEFHPGTVISETVPDKTLFHNHLMHFASCIISPVKCRNTWYYNGAHSDYQTDNGNDPISLLIFFEYQGYRKDQNAKKEMSVGSESKYKTSDTDEEILH